MSHGKQRHAENKAVIQADALKQQQDFVEVAIEVS